MPPTPTIQRRFLYVAVFAAGVTTLAVELSASRLLGSVFGTSNLVWANIIGLILLYLAIGYFLGGRWADRSPRYLTFYRILTWAAFLSGLAPLIARPVLAAAAGAVAELDAGVAVGSFVVVLVLFAAPVTLLGCISPFAIRLAISEVSAAGGTAGRLYAISTLGGLIGTFGPVLVLIPQVGTTRTFLIFAGALMLVGFAGLGVYSRPAALQLLWMPIVLIALALAVLEGPLKPPPPKTTLLYERDSAYNYIQVVEVNDPEDPEYRTRYLLLNEGQGIHSEWHPTRAITGGTWDFFLAAPYFNPAPFDPECVRRDGLALIGLAAGTVARQYTTVYGDIPIDGIEIDPGVVRAGRLFFEMNQPNLSVIVEDGRLALAHSPHTYAVVGIDAYRVPYVPWQLTTREFFAQVHAHLTPDGVTIINVGRTQTDRHLVEALTATMLTVFPSVHTLDVPRSFNTLLVGTVQPTQAHNLTANLTAMEEAAEAPHPVLYAALSQAVEALVPTAASDLILTDDHAPVESIVDSLVINFYLQAGQEALETLR